MHGIDSIHKKWMGKDFPEECWMQLCATCNEGMMDVHELLYLYTTDLQQDKPELIKRENSIQAIPYNSELSASSFQPNAPLFPCHPLIHVFKQSPKFSWGDGADENNILCVSL